MDGVTVELEGLTYGQDNRPVFKVRVVNGGAVPLADPFAGLWCATDPPELAPVLNGAAKQLSCVKDGALLPGEERRLEVTCGPLPTRARVVRAVYRVAVFSDGLGLSAHSQDVVSWDFPPAV